MKNKLLTCLLVACGLGLTAQNAKVSEENLRTDIGFFASDWLKGREPGTKGERLASDHIEEVFESLDLKPAGESGYRQKFTYKTKLSPHDTVFNGPTKKAVNMIAFLDNNAIKTIVIGAHFDHLGMNGHGSSLDKNSKQIHNGADDNASGTAAVLELARYYKNNGIVEPVNFLFMCFSGEEDGLIGSKYYTNHPTQPLEKVKCMINMDMVGRLNDSTKKLMIYGVGTSSAYTKIFEGRTGGFNLVFDSAGIGPSDQTSFYLKNIPVLHFFTGQHSDYHKSSDDAEKINYSGEVAVLNYIIELTDAIALAAEMPFTATKSQESNKISFKVTLGIMPDYTWEKEGVRIDAVTEGKPASNAGMKPGDIVLQLGEIKTNSMQGYMKALSMFKKGESTIATIKRGEETLQINVTF